MAVTVLVAWVVEVVVVIGGARVVMMVVSGVDVVMSSVVVASWIELVTMVGGSVDVTRLVERGRDCVAVTTTWELVRVTPTVFTDTDGVIIAHEDGLAVTVAERIVPGDVVRTVLVWAWTNCEQA